MATRSYAYVVTTAEFVANLGFTKHDQSDPDIAMRSNGGFVLGYTGANENGADNSGLDFALDAYGAAATFAGGTGYFPAGTQNNLAVAGLSDGGYLAAGYNAAADGAAGGSSIVWQKNGLPVSNPNIVGNESDDQFSPAVTGLTGDRFAIVWTDEASGDATDLNIRLSVFNNAGDVTVKNATFVASGAGNQRLPAVSATSTGGFVVAWSDDGADSTATRVMAQRYDSEGNKLGAAIVVADVGDNDSADVVGLDDGGFAVAYMGGPAGAGKISIMRIFNADGTARTGSLSINSRDVGDSDPTIEKLANGFITVSWTHNVAGANDDLYLRTFLSNGDAVTGAFRYQGTDIDAIRQSQSTIGATVDGRLVAAWNDAEVLDAGGSHIGAEILALRRTTTGDASDEFLLAGDALQDIINGLGGRDGLAGFGGADQLNGGDGDDSLNGGADADIIDGGAGSDWAVYSEKTAPVVIFLNGAADATAMVGGVAEDTLRQIENLLGGSAGDVLVGDASSNRIDGDDGADYLFSAGFNADGSLRAGAGDDTLNGDAGNDGLFAGDGADTLNGGDGQDGMVGGAGNDTLNGDAGVDFLFGGAFNPADGARLPNSGADILNGGADGDGLYGFDGDDTLNGDAGDDYVEAGDGNDALNGGAANDFLLGQNGNDTINGGTGFDYLYGGAGADSFVFRKDDSADWILDFSAAEGDRLRFLDFGFANFAAIPLVDLSTPGHSAVQMTITIGGATDQLTIFGVTLAQLNAVNVLVA